MGLRQVGDMLAAKYRVEALLGSGGMGDVYRATNTLVNREVAIKLLHVKHVGDADLVERFVREARVANIVRHPNVVDVLDIDKDTDGSPFIVQELLYGQDLAKYARERGRLGLDEIRELVVPIVEAVAAAHLQNVIHRDIKPANVFLATERSGSGGSGGSFENPPSSGARRARANERSAPRSGVRTVPKLLDFGISKLRSADIRATDVGVLLGTPAYMAPELLRAGVRDADAQSDVWALGVMLFELLAGRRPYIVKGPSIYVAIATEDVPPLLDIAPDIDRDVAEVVMRCLRRSVDERFASAAELAMELSAALNAADLRAPTISVEPVLPLDPIVVPDLDLPVTLGGADKTIVDDVGVGGVTRVDSTLASQRPGRPAGQQVAVQEHTERMSSAPAHLSSSPSSSARTHRSSTAPLGIPVSAPPPTTSPSRSEAPRPSRAPARSGLMLDESGSPAPRSLPPMRYEPPADRQTNASFTSNRNEGFLWLEGLFVLGLTALALAGVLIAMLGRPAGFAIVRPFAETSEAIAMAGQLGAGLVVGVLGLRAFRGGLRHWQGASRFHALAYAATSGALLFVVFELVRAAW